MKEYEFAVILDVPQLTDELDVSLAEAGCTDGLICASQGIVKVIFGRSGDSLENAIRSAIADVQKAGVNIVRVEIARDSEVLKVG